MLARLTFWLVPLSFLTISLSVDRSSFVNSTIYFFMATSLSKGSFAEIQDHTNPNI